MKKIFTITLVLLISNLANAQLAEVQATIKGPVASAPSTNNVFRSSSPVVCGTDTAEYPVTKTSAYQALNFNSNNSASQFYGSPDSIVVKGFTFFAWMSSAARSQKVKVICKIYKAGLDSLPTGSPLRADTLTIDSTFGGGQLANLAKHATFKTSITVNFDYVLVVTNTDTSNLAIIMNSWNNGDGNLENLSGASISGTWYRGLNLNVGGTTLDADFSFYPHVQASFKTNFLVKNQCYKLGDSVKFINLAGKSAVGNKFYNRYVAYNLERFCYRWYNDTTAPFSSYNSIDGGAKYPIRKNYGVRLESSLFHYRLGGAACRDTTDILVKYSPIPPIPKGISNTCNGDSAGLTITQYQQENYAWYKNLTDTTPNFTGLNYTQNPALKNDTFYVQTNNLDCKSNKNIVTILVNEYPKITRIKNDSICSGANANLEVSSDIGTTTWFKDSVGGSSFYTGPVLAIGPLTKDTVLYAEVGNGNCTLPKRTAVTVSVGSSFAPSAPAVSNDTTLCLQDAGSITLSAAANGSDMVRWFDSASGGSVLAQSNTYSFTPNAEGLFTFYADAWNGICGSSRVPIKIRVNHFDAPKNIMDDEICFGSNASLNAQIGKGTLSWFIDTAQSAVFIGTNLTLTKPTTTTKYYLRSSYLGCTSKASWFAQAVVNKAPTPTKLKEETICAKQIANLAVEIGFGEVNWFTDTLTGTSFHALQQYTTSQLFGTKTYFYQTSFKGCKSYFSPITATVNPKPAAGFTFSVSALTATYTALTNPNNTSYNWDMGNGVTKTGAIVNYTYPNAGIYNIQLIVDNLYGCKDTIILEVNVGRVGLDVVSGKFFQIYPNPSHNETIEIHSDMNLSEITVVNLEGKLIMTQAIENSENQYYYINLDAPNGVYIMLLKDKQGKIFTERVVKN